jgi:hypothetical protein
LKTAACRDTLKLKRADFPEKLTNVRPYAVTYQKAGNFIINVVRTSNPVKK